jgi:hypothetical protein
MRFGFNLLLVAILLAFPQTQAKVHGPDKELASLVAAMIGSFSSANQAKADSAYYDIRLHLAPIWEKSAVSTHNTYWLYVEQAMASKMDAPYRQRVYKVYRDPASNALFSEVYTLPNPARFVGAWNANSSILKSITPDSLLPRAGCHIVLKPAAKGVFNGATIANNCPSDLRGASYATSQVHISSDTLLSWDRGFDATGKQVWGADKGGYIFIKDKK